MRAGSTGLAIALLSCSATPSGWAAHASPGIATRLIPPPLPLTHKAAPSRSIQPPEGLAGFRFQVDVHSGRPVRAIGGRLAWIPGAGNELKGPSLEGHERREALFQRAEAFVQEHAGIYRLAPKALVRDEHGTVSIPDQELDVVRLGLREDGLPVAGGQLVFVVRFGNLVYFGSSHVNAPGEARPVSPPVANPLAADAAREHLAGYLGVAVDDLEPRPWVREQQPSRFVLPASLEDGIAAHRRVQALRVRPRGEIIDYEAWLDQDSAEVLAFFPAERSCSGPAAAVTGRVVAGVRPARATDPEELRSLPWADIGGGQFASRKGTFSWSDPLASSTLSGRYATINCLACNNPTQALATVDASGRINFGVNFPIDIDSSGNGTSTTASRTAYAHVNTAHDLAAKWLGTSLSFLDRPLEVQVNGQNSCNAFWSGFALRFFESAPDCRNSGEIRDVVAHEWGHALDDFDGTATSDFALSEGASDVFASFLDRNTCIADSIWVDPLLGASGRCAGLRDTDEQAPQLKHTPAVMTWSSNDCLGGSHCLGEVYGQTAWHLVRNLITGRSYADSSPLGPAYGEELGWEIAERLFLLSRPLAETMNPAAAGVSLYDAYVLADEDATGNRPHVTMINEAFRHHELIEASPYDPGGPCTAPADPQIILADVSRGSDGEPEVALWWRDSNAVEYRVLRRRIGAELAWMPVTSAPVRDDNRPQYGLLDGALENGREYQYWVLAVGAAGCWSAGAAQVTVALTLPQLTVSGHAERDPAPGGDNDSVIEPGEFFETRIDLSETLALAPASGVTATLFSQDPLVRVGVPDRIVFGDVPAGGTVTQVVPFTLYIDPLHPCPATIPLVVRVESDQGCSDRAFSIDIAAAGCSAAERSDVRFVSAAVVDDAVNPACTDNDLVLDGGEKASLRVTVENVGVAEASEVEVVLSTPDPRITFVSGSRASLPGPLAPGGSADLNFDVLAGDLPCGQLIAFTAEVRAPENLQPDPAAFELATELDTTANTLVWDFETGAQGWSGDGAWSLSRARANPADTGQSFWSGSQFNQCSTLTSPPFELRPSQAATLTLATWYEMQGRFQAKYWDGVNVYLVGAGTPVLLTPSAGRGYDASLTKLVSCETNTPAWCADNAGKSWASSSFDLSAWAGQTVRVALHCSTDNNVNNEGFYLDDVTVNNVMLSTCDARVCPPDPACSTPEMRVTADANGCQGAPVALQAQFDFLGTGAFNYEWDFGDGDSLPTTVPDAPVAHVYTQPGSFIARLTASRVLDPLCSSTATVSVAVSAEPLVDAGPDANAPVRIGTPPFAGLSYSWTPSAGLDDPTLAQPTAFPGLTTEYCVEVRDTLSGCLRGDCVLVTMPLLCGLDANAVGDLKLAKRGSDVVATWSPVAGTGTYDTYRITDKEQIPAAMAINTTAFRVSTAGTPGATDAGQVSVPPATSFYQAIVRCP